MGCLCVIAQLHFPSLITNTILLNIGEFDILKDKLMSKKTVLVWSNIRR